MGIVIINLNPKFPGWYFCWVATMPEDKQQWLTIQQETLCYRVDFEHNATQRFGSYPKVAIALRGFSIRSTSL
jgi:hypothetical protein